MRAWPSPWVTFARASNRSKQSDGTLFFSRCKHTPGCHSQSERRNSRGWQRCSVARAERPPNRFPFSPMKPVSFPDVFSLKNEHVLITGGGTGIGLAIAHAMHAAGARIVLVGRR